MIWVILKVSDGGDTISIWRELETFLVFGLD